VAGLAIRALACAAVVVASNWPAARAGAAVLRLRALPGGRAEVRLVGAAGTHVIRLDGRRVARTDRRVVRMSVWRRGHFGWRRLVVRRAGSGAVIARARFAVGAASSRAAPTLLLLHRPAATATAVLRFSAAGGRPRCGRDGGALRPCSSPLVYRRLRAGVHRFALVAANRRGHSVIRLAWRVVAGPVFEDDFGGRALDRRAWSPYDSAGNAGHGLRRPSAIALDGAGHLVITASMVGGRLVSGGMASRLGTTYGRFEFRVRTDADPSATMSGVVLTWPDSGRWPVEGEDDIYETGAESRFPFHSYVHYGSDNRQYRFTHSADATRWHTLAMDWRAGGIRFYRDGAPAGTVTDPAAIPRTPHHLAIQLDATRDATLARPVRMYVDWVRIYR
jgi:endo-1,3-1,4-beta-glycanase ExoK